MKFLTLLLITFGVELSLAKNAQVSKVAPLNINGFDSSIINRELLSIYPELLNTSSYNIFFTSQHLRGNTVYYAHLPNPSISFTMTQAKQLFCQPRRLDTFRQLGWRNDHFAKVINKVFMSGATRLPPASFQMRCEKSISGVNCVIENFMNEVVCN